ncbi:MAG: GntR family transcriptional regulator [Thermomicrobiales bacterium]|nr:GntR family transcriptional regulator [Thermomicrobiales bacterium]
MARSPESFSQVESSKRTLQAQIVNYIRDAIVRGDLGPGARLRTEEIAGQFGISRIPVREALHELVAEGFVTVVPQRGAFVAELSVEDLEEIYLLRSSLEPLAARLAVENLTEALIEHFSAMIDEMEASENDLPLWSDIDLAFHMDLYSAAGRPRLFKMISSLRTNALRYTALYIHSPDYMPIVRVHHRELLDAYLRRDPDLAAQRTREHIQDFGAYMVRELRKVLGEGEEIDGRDREETSIESNGGVAQFGQ